MEFRDGEFVAKTAGAPAGVPVGESVVPNEETGFRLAVKPGALEVNESLVDLCDDHGTVLSFGTVEDAETFAAQLSADGGSLQVQDAAPNDPAAVDAYLLAEYDRSIEEPAAIDGDTWTFDVGANLYGALGETIVTTGSTPPALEYFVRQDLDGTPGTQGDDLQITVDRDASVSVDAPDQDGRARWIPDCRIEVRERWDGPVVEQYWCEVKTGDASFERSQKAAMRALANDRRVLKIRVLIEDLPDRYAIRIREIEPGTD